MNQSCVSIINVYWEKGIECCLWYIRWCYRIRKVYIILQYSIARIDTTEAAVVCVYCSFLPTRCGIKSMLCFRNQLLFNYINKIDQEITSPMESYYKWGCECERRYRWWSTKRSITYNFTSLGDESWWEYRYMDLARLD